MAGLAEAAKGEGKVVVYGGPGPVYRQALVDRFQQAYPGIQVEFTGGVGAPEATKLVQERAAGQYTADVFISGTTNMVVTLKDAGAVDPLVPALLPDNARPEAWYDGKLQWADQVEPRTTLMFECYVNEIVFVNPTLVDPKQFTSYKDLLDPKWKGKIAGTDIRQPGPGGVPSRYMYKHADLGPPYLTQLFHDTDVVLSSDQRQLIDWLAQGTYPIGIFVSGSDVQVAQKQGLAVASVPPEQFKEGAVLGPGYGAVSLMNRPPHPKAAQLYVNWLLSQEGQKAWQMVTGESSCRTDISREGASPTNTPKPGVKYANAGTEEYSRLTGSVIRDLITDAISSRPKT
jgi:iron(III) transport system substrate-binding protein